MPETAARHLVTRVPTGRAGESAASLIDRLREQRYELVDAVYVLDDEGRLRGVVPWHHLLGAAPEAPVESLMQTGVPTVDPDCDQEHAASAALSSRITSVPVVDGTGKFLGVVPALALLEILRHEHVEDLHRLAGIARENKLVVESLEELPVRRARHRLPWLLVGLVGSMLAALIMSGFERTLQQNLAVSFFVPAIVYLADAIGTQTEAIVVRGLSLSHQPLRRLLANELGTGVLIGAALGALALPIVWIAFGDLRLGVSVGLAVLAAGAAATSIGLLLPWLLQRAGSDPALGSGPLATIIQDVLSLLIYFAIATALLR